MKLLVILLSLFVLAPVLLMIAVRLWLVDWGRLWKYARVTWRQMGEDDRQVAYVLAGFVAFYGWYVVAIMKGW